MNGEYGGYIDFASISTCNNIIDDDSAKKSGQQKYFFNLGRHCLSFLLMKNAVKQIYLPEYTCTSVKKIAESQNYRTIFYNINSNFEPIVPDIAEGSIVLINNFFGLSYKACKSFIKSHIKNNIHIIVDNTQSICKTSEFANVSSFISPRKFLPVTDGGILFAKILENEEKLLPTRADSSWDRIHWMARCIDECSKSQSYSDYKSYRNDLQTFSYMRMSKSTMSMLRLFDLSEIIRDRNNNYARLKECFYVDNIFKNVALKSTASPIGFPLKVDNSELTQAKLAKEGIYTIRYWPELKHIIAENSVERYLLDKTLFLAIHEMPTQEQIDKIARFNLE